ncbi:MAG: U32 family peptidase, partial [Campylobacter sp.]|nr:U32 family peptidase [Campylobacter sp.]
LDAQVWADLGAVRIVAAREMTLKDAVEIKDKIPNLEIEIFVHGSMCFAYSGRCLVSAVQSGRFSNRGSCANDCRFNYELYAKNPETSALFRLQEREGEGTFVMNAKDLSLISHVQKIMQTGAIDSFKIEGRTKSEYYVACATNAYRAAIDDAASDKFEAHVYEREIATLKNRGFSDGYLIKRPYEREDTQNLDRSIELGTHQVCAISQDGEFISVKDKILPGVSYEIFAPRGFKICACDNEIGEIYELSGKPYLKFKKLQSRSGKEFSEIHSGNLNEIKLPAKLAEFCFLRKEIE